jgi:hypothetical protein
VLVYPKKNFEGGGEVAEKNFEVGGKSGRKVPPTQNIYRLKLYLNIKILMQFTETTALCCRSLRQN